MSLGVVVKGPEGVVLAADSRVTVLAGARGQPAVPVHFDNATKMLTFSGPHNYVAAVTYGAAVIGQRTAHGYLPEFEQTVLSKFERLMVSEYAGHLSAFFLERWVEIYGENVSGDYAGPPLTFIVGGYDPGEAYGSVYVFAIPSAPDPRPQNPGGQFGMTWGGQLEIASRIIHGYDPTVLPQFLERRFSLSTPEAVETVRALQAESEFRIPYQLLPLQDCVDLAIFLIRGTMTAQGLGVGVRGVGGPVDVAYITRTEGLTYVQRKGIRGET